MLSKMKRKLMICAMALCICAGLTGNTGEVSVWASEESSSDAVRIGALIAIQTFLSVILYII